MEFKSIQYCEKCGGELKFEHGEYRCVCGFTYTADSARLAYEALKATVERGAKNAIDEAFVRARESRIANARAKIWTALHSTEKYFDGKEVENAANDILSIDSKAVDARFFRFAAAKKWNDVKSFLLSDEFDAKKNASRVLDFVDFLTGALAPEDCLVALRQIVAAAFTETDVRYSQCNEKINEAEKHIKSGIFDPCIERDIFIAYSSKDIEIVRKLVVYLEEKEYRCFVSERNSLRGLDSHIVYEDDLKAAIDHCKVFLFVSTRNSRSRGCKARFELEYIREQDLKRLPVEFENAYRNDYASLGAAYKRPRVEYLVEEYAKNGIEYEKSVAAFFNGFSRASTLEEVLAFVGQEISRIPKLVREEKKFCAGCGKENPSASNFCPQCGKNEFVATKKEYELLETVSAYKAETERLQKELKEEQESGTALRQQFAELEAREKALQEELKKTQEERDSLKQQEETRLKKQQSESKSVTNTADSKSAYRKGDDYYLGRNGVEKDYAKAIEWYTKAYELGDKRAPRDIARCYYLGGHGVEKDYAKAIEWYTKAYELGDKDAPSGIASCYYYGGHGVEKDYAKAVECFLKARKKGDGSVLYFLGECYYWGGHGIQKDDVKAIEYYKEAVAEGTFFHNEAATRLKALGVKI